MKKKNDFKRKVSPPERDDQKEKCAVIPPVGDLQQEIREMRQAMINVRNLPFERHYPEAIPDSIEELYQRLKKLETRLDRLEQRVSASPYDPENRGKNLRDLLIMCAVMAISMFLLVLFSY